MHDFAIPFAPGVTRVLTGEIALTRSFWLVRHADDRASDRLSRLAEAVAGAMRREVLRLQDLAAVESDDGLDGQR